MAKNNEKQSEAEKPITDDRPKFGPLQAIFASIGILILAEVFVYTIFDVGLEISGLSEKEGAAWLERPLAQFLAMLATSLVIYGLIRLYLSKKQLSWSSIGVVSPKINDAWKGVLAFGVYLLISITLLDLATNFLPGLDVTQEQEIGFDKDSTIGWSLALAFAGLTILPSLIEELLFRGLLYTGLRKKLNFLWAALLTSVIFAAGHLQLGFGDSPLWVAAIDTFILSIILVYLREKYGSIWPGSMVHFIKNSLAFLLIFVFRVT